MLKESNRSKSDKSPSGRLRRQIPLLSTRSLHVMTAGLVVSLLGLLLNLSGFTLGIRVPGTPSSARTMYRKYIAWLFVYRKAPAFDMFVPIDQWTPDTPGFPSPDSVCRRVLSGAQPSHQPYFPLHDGVNSTGSVGVRTDRELCEALESMRRSFRVYTYQLPRSLSNPHETCSWSNRAYNAEAAVIRSLEKGPLATQDPEEASMFLIPTTTCEAVTSVTLTSVWYWLRNGFQPARNDHRTDGAVRLEQSLEVAQPRAVFEQEYDSPNAPRFTHMFVVSSGVGCELAKRSSLLDRALCLTNTADDGYGPDRVSSKIGLVPAYSPELHRILSSRLPFSKANDESRRSVAYFSGNLWNYGRADKSCRKYIGDGFTALTEEKRARFRVIDSDETPESYMNSMLTSKYCLQPYGHRPWSPRLAEGIWAGCVPVILADKYDLPHSHVLDWSKFSVIVPGAIATGTPEVCARVFELLLAIPDAQYREYRRHLAAVQPFFAYEEPSQFGDQLWLTLLTAQRTGERLRQGAPNAFTPYPKEREGKFV